MTVTHTAPESRVELSHAAVLDPEARARVAADTTIGGGNLLRAARAASPDPSVPFLHSDTPVPTPGGGEAHVFSLDDLAALVDSWSAWYLDQGVGPRDRVAVFFGDSFQYSVHFQAIAQIGAIGMMINSNAPRESARHLITTSGAIALVSDAEHVARLGTEVTEGLHWTVLVEDVPAPPAATLSDAERFRHADDDPVVLLHSSGTTGLPKAVMHTHRTIVAGPQFRLVDHTEAPGALMMTALPQSHLGCIAYTNYAILGGTPLVALRDGPGEELAAALRRYRPTSVMAFGHAYSELASVELAPGTVDSVDVWVSVGDAVHHRHIQHILGERDGSRRPARFFDRLGTTELGWGVLLQIRLPGDERQDRLGGKPTGVAEVDVLRTDGTSAAPGEYGYLGARGPAITPGYWNNDDTTYRSRLGGYWLTGDVAFRDEEGNFYQVDRAVDAIVTREGTGYSVLMEEILLSDVAAITDCTVIAGRDGDRVVPVAVVKLVGDDTETDLPGLLAAANDALAARRQPTLGLLTRAIEADDFPVGVTGKVLKRRLRERFTTLPAATDAGHGTRFCLA